MHIAKNFLWESLHGAKVPVILVSALTQTRTRTMKIPDRKLSNPPVVFGGCIRTSPKAWLVAVGAFLPLLLGCRLLAFTRCGLMGFNFFVK